MVRGFQRGWYARHERRDLPAPGAQLWASACSLALAEPDSTVGAGGGEVDPSWVSERFFYDGDNSKKGTGPLFIDEVLRCLR